MTDLAKAIRIHSERHAKRAGEVVRLGEVTDISTLEIELLDSSIVLEEDEITVAQWPRLLLDNNSVSVGDTALVLCRKDGAEIVWTVIDFLAETAFGWTDFSAAGNLTVGGNIDAGGNVNIAAGKKYKINGVALAAADLGIASDPVAGTAGLRTLGTGAQQAAAGNDSRLSDARTPTTHVSSHAPGGTDALPWTTAHGYGTYATRPAAASSNAGYLYFAWDTGGLFRSNGTSWDLVQQTPGSGTSIPTSDLYTGREYIYDAGGGVQWRFRYNSASASSYKWEFIGGGRLRAYDGGDRTWTAVTNTWNDTGTVVSITVPLAGDYEVDYRVDQYCSATGQHYVGVGIATSNPSGFDQVGELQLAASIAGCPDGYGLYISLSANTVLKHWVQAPAGTAHSRGRQMRVRPLRITG